MGCPLSSLCALTLSFATTASTSTGTPAAILEEAAPPPIIELITFAPGPDLYSFWGHAAIRVIDPASGRDVIYNFGSVDFSGNFLIRLLSGRVDAYVSVTQSLPTFRAYQKEDRTIVRRRLAVDPEGARRIAARLADYVRGDRYDYRYHHFEDNCSTRVAQEIDGAFDGAIRSQSVLQKDKTYRERALALVRPYTALYVYVDILMTEPIDRPIDRWEATFLPHILADVIDQATVDGRPAVAEKIPFYVSPKDKTREDPGWPWLKIYLLLVIPLAAVTYWRPRGGALVIGVLFGLLGCSIALLWFGTSYNFLQNNLNLALFPPTHLVLAWAAVRYERFRRLRPIIRGYVFVHLLALIGLTVAVTTHVFAQALEPALGLALPTTLVLAVKVRRSRD